MFAKWSSARQVKITNFPTEKREKRKEGGSGETASLSWSISRREKFNLPGCPSGRGWVSMLLNTLKGFAASPSGWQSVGLMSMNVRASWRPATISPTPLPPLCCYSYAALGNWSWNLLTNCLDFAWFVPWAVSFESWVLRVESWELPELLHVRKFTHAWTRAQARTCVLSNAASGSGNSSGNIASDLHEISNFRVSFCSPSLRKLSTHVLGMCVCEHVCVCVCGWNYLVPWHY